MDKGAVSTANFLTKQVLLLASLLAEVNPCSNPFRKFESVRAALRKEG
jgi:hypothetical protein